MRVIFITRPTVFSGPGGDTVQLLKTAEYLKQHNVDITIADTVNPCLDDYDIVHFFNLRNPQDLLFNLRRVKRKNIPCVLSTIWGSYYECDIKKREGIAGIITRAFSEPTVEYIKSIARVIANGNYNKSMLPYFLRGHYRSQKEIASSVDVLLPNSSTELERVKSDMQLPDKAGFSIVNAVDLKQFNYSEVQVSPVYEKYKGCLLCAARIEIRKSQLDLIKAFKDLPYKLVLVGKPSPNSIKYYNSCKSEAGDNVVFIDHVSHDELAQLYKVAKAHALISWMETPGLSSLEAAAMKCNLLITDRGDTKYYFENLATYCEPGDIDSIRSGILKVMSTDFNESLFNRVTTQFTWEKTAEQTYEAYKYALNRCD